MPYQSAYDLLQGDMMKQAQLGAMGQEGRLRDLQMQQAQQGQQDTAQLRDLLTGASQNGGIEALLPHLLSGKGGMQGLELGMKIQQATQKSQPKYHVIGGALVPEPSMGQAGNVAPVYQAPEKPEKINPNQPFMVENGQIVPNKAYQSYEMGKTIAGRPSVSVSMGQEKEEAKTVGKGFGEQYMDWQKSGLSANNKMSKYDRMTQLLTGIETGKLTPTGMQVSAIADSLGFKIDPSLPAKQAVEALSGEMSLELRNPSGGAGMPGAMSDKDREFLQGMTPGVAKTPGGNTLILETAKKLAKRDKEVAALSREYRSKHGSIDEGFYNELATFADNNPLFPNSGQTVTNPKFPGFSIKR